MEKWQTLSGSGRLLTKYRVRFAVLGVVHIWERWGGDMEGCLASAKRALAREYGDMWRGSVAICGPQGDSGVYCF